MHITNYRKDPLFQMKLQRLLSLLRQAIDQYQMIEHGDHIAIGISGGKDSLTLLYGLSQLQKFYPKHFTLSAITVDMGLDTMNLEPVKTLCADFNVPYEIIFLRPVMRLIHVLFVQKCEKAP